MTIIQSTYSPCSASEFASKERTFDRPTSIQHWQLRDLVSCPVGTNDIYTVHEASTIKYNPGTGRTTFLQDLMFKPTCMACNGEFIAAGGQHKQLDVKNLETGATIFKDTVGSSVNNALHMAKDLSGHDRLFVCNNDEFVRVFSLPRMSLVHQISTICAPVNYASLSPNGAHLACVGDCNHMFLYQCTPTGYQREGVMTEAEDSGMCCAWSSSSNCVASVSQDGVLCVWDIRSASLVVKYGSGGRAFRSVKFSSGPADLLAFTEHESRVHLVDSRMYGTRQLLRVAGPEYEADISGLAFTPNGHRLYVGMFEGIHEYIVDTVGRCSFQSGSLL